MDLQVPPAAPAPVAIVNVAASTNDAAQIAALDIAFQKATKHNDAAMIDAILHPDFVLVLGNGTRIGRKELIAQAHTKAVTYEIQDEDPGTQQVQMFGDVGIVTARLRIKGSRAGAAFDRTLWFSDTYVRTPSGWRYAFAQASLPLPSR